MPSTQDLPNALRPFRFHGVEFDYVEGADHAEGECPFCGKDKKFRINATSGLWDCKVCGTGSDNKGGNIYTFFNKYWEQCKESQNGDVQELADIRGYTNAGSIDEWGIVKSVLLDEWLVPGYNAAGKMTNLYRYNKIPGENKYRLLATPGLAHAIHGPLKFAANLKDKDTIYLCEGPWDGVALYELLRRAKSDGKELMPTGNAGVSLYANAGVLAVPGCQVFPEAWAPLFAGKTVVLMYDNDHPRTVNGKTFKDAYDAMKRAAQVLARAEEKPTEILHLQWGKEGFDPALPTGYDVRDMLTSSESLGGRVRKLGELLNKVQKIPPDWLGAAVHTERGKVGQMDCKPCMSWKELIGKWELALKWTEGLDIAFSSMLAVSLSTLAVGDQVWLRVIGPPACGKSTLCEALSVNTRYILAKSNMRGFHSGFKSDNDGKQDNSLIAKLKGKTLITKDGDTLLNSVNKDLILAEARDLFDAVARSHYRHGLDRDYTGIRITWILCGTGALHSLDTSELGERFLTVVITDKIDEELEDEILLMKGRQAEKSVGFQAGKKAETQHDPTMVECMQLTGGYINWLRENAKDTLSKVEMTDETIRRVIHMAKFVAYMRARPSKRQEESTEREFATRLTSQLVRMAKCLAVVLNRESVDKEVMKRVKKIALDTCRGRTIEIAKHLYESGGKGLDLDTIARRTSHGVENQKKLLIYLKRIEAVQLFSPKKSKTMASRNRWRLTPRFYNLFNEVMGKGEKEATWK